MWEANRWNEDSTYHAPMVVCNGAHVFAGDIVDFCSVDDESETIHRAKVMSFYTDEDVCISQCHDNILLVYCLLCRMY